MGRKVVKYLGTQPRVFTSVWKGKSIDVGVGAEIEVDEAMADKLDSIVLFNEKQFEILVTSPKTEAGIVFSKEGEKSEQPVLTNDIVEVIEKPQQE